MEVVRLSPASPSEGLRALEEVEHFGSTDMGWGGEQWTYRILSEEQVTPELLQKCQMHGTNGRVDYASLQPCTSYEARSQDRLVVQKWDMPDGQWTFSGIFDGHGSHETVDFVVEHLPARVKAALHIVLAHGTTASDTISRLLSDSIVGIDSVITSKFLSMFPEGRDGFAKLSDREIASILEHEEATAGSQNSLRCLSGSTALLTLVDPTGSQLWVANLGDCRAVLISEDHDGKLLARRLMEVHNGGNESELDRVRYEHPGEEECVLNKRVLGFLAPTRALGDTWMKLPASYSRRALSKRREFHAVGLAEDHLDRVQTPPYVSSTPQVLHHQLRRVFEWAPGAQGPVPPPDAAAAMHGSVRADVALVLCSDGLVDLYEDHDDVDETLYLAQWAAQIGDALARAGRRAGAPPPGNGNASASGAMNLAVHLLREAVGGADVQRASANLTVEMDERWMDDTTIIVQRFSS